MANYYIKCTNVTNIDLKLAKTAAYACRKRDISVFTHSVTTPTISYAS